MTHDVRITFHGMETSPALVEAIESRFQKLRRFADGITDCHVIVEMRGRKQHGISAHLTYANGRADADELQHDHEDGYATVGRVFDRLERQLRDLHSRRSDH